ncbi:MAG: rod shape-determining protein MreC [Deltaproteobacteria bacterium]|nr:rod shape-determining protein MreC [Deltaproteobacteria bacterium]
MHARRLLFLPVILLFLFLGLFTWNQRTGRLDALTVHFGLEATGAVLTLGTGLYDHVHGFYARYVDLVGVREENDDLKAEVERMRGELRTLAENQAELRRLRDLLVLPDAEGWKPIGARVIAGRIGPNAALESVMINRGYLSGGAPGTPVITHLGVVGRVLRASPSAATVLLLTNPGSRIAVLSQQTRTRGILAGRSTRLPMEMRYVTRNYTVHPGEVLITSGLDGAYPKDIPVARVLSVVPSDFSQFQNILAQPLVDIERLEEVMLLERPARLATGDADSTPPVLQGDPPPAPPGLPQKRQTERLP